MKLIIQFYECEHQGDLQHYLDQMPKNVKVLGSQMADDETGRVLIEVEDRASLVQALEANPEIAGLYSLHNLS